MTTRVQVTSTICCDNHAHDIVLNDRLKIIRNVESSGTGSSFITKHLKHAKQKKAPVRFDSSLVQTVPSATESIYWSRLEYQKYWLSRRKQI